MISPDNAVVPLVEVEQVRAQVDALLTEHVDGLAAELSSLSPDADHLTRAMRSMLSGGKRLRAAFCYWSWRAHSPSPSAEGSVTGLQEVLRVGAALELFQAAALFHDDVMDNSDTRRGHPTAHRRFERLHSEKGWTGEAPHFGVSAAILLGDLALIASEREFSRALRDLPATTRASAALVFDRMRTEVTAGQFLDVLGQVLPWGTDPVADESRARTVIRSKSARYSIEHPVSLGAALAGADTERLAVCRAVGLPLGEAFQLRDDLLGVFGDPRTTGKPAGDDLREGKRTVLVARVMQHADEADRLLVQESLGRLDLSEEDVSRLRQAIQRSGAVAGVERLISELSEPALEMLRTADLAEPGRGMLVSLGRAAVERTS
ncbi:polyprenyl synthetase family protein [Actinotalea sp. K2]|uniref:polyprenyl synthetase family protein n=1 Tax=Actinotalea sp. K2 TaxID=2939438 RepID=UPI002017F4CB|nr:polyprenyl synthetase family protein [Actinotalea sp. K2]MCL3862179.1 polyprenyl synthetase family protein [Actinotalea sp. K2]